MKAEPNIDTFNAEWDAVYGEHEEEIAALREEVYHLTALRTIDASIIKRQAEEIKRLRDVLTMYANDDCPYIDDPLEECVGDCDVCREDKAKQALEGKPTP